MNLLNIEKNIDNSSKSIRGDNKGLKDHIKMFSENTKGLIMLSGGIDSTTLFYLCRRLGMDLEGLEFTYEGRPFQENEIIKNISRLTGLKYSNVSYPFINFLDGTKLDFQESNSFYYSIAASYAYSRRIKYILSGQILDDWYDSDTSEASPVFYSALNQMLGKEYGINAPEVLTPFIYLTKKQVVNIGIELGVDFKMTRSCTDNGLNECGLCEQCIDRENALSIL